MSKLGDRDFSIAYSLINRLKGFIKGVIIDEEETIDLLLATVLAGGHVLITGPIGSGKTTLARALAKAMGGSFARVQMTNETLPSDLVGFVVYTRDGGSHVVKGPIFNNVVLLDDINNAPPRTLSALLQAMQEGKVSLDGNVLKLPMPNIVIATMNTTEMELGIPSELSPVFLDRFMSNIWTRYLDMASEKETLRNIYEIERLLMNDNASPVMNIDDLVFLMGIVQYVYTADSILDYIVSIIQEVRSDERVAVPVSTRASISMYKLSKAVALINGRNYVIPDDVKTVAYPVLNHRIIIKMEYRDSVKPMQIISDVLSRVPVPR